MLVPVIDILSSVVQRASGFLKTSAPLTSDIWFKKKKNDSNNTNQQTRKNTSLIQTQQ